LLIFNKLQQKQYSSRASYKIRDMASSFLYVGYHLWKHTTTQVLEFSKTIVTILL